MKRFLGVNLGVKPSWDTLRPRILDALAEVREGALVRADDEQPILRWRDGPGESTVAEAVGDVVGWSWSLWQPEPADEGSQVWLDRAFSVESLAVAVVRDRASPGVPNDRERELRYHQVTNDPEGRWWPSYESQPSAPQVMLHFAINRDAGAIRGRSDLAQIIPWLTRYDRWLTDRVRLNTYKTAFLWHVQIENAQPSVIEAKRAQYAHVPSPGSIIVSDASETWNAVQPSIGADDAEADGHALRMMIAAGAGIPLHWLAEPEGANRATATEMREPIIRRIEARRTLFLRAVQTIIAAAIAREGKPGQPALRYTDANILTPTTTSTQDPANATDS